MRITLSSNLCEYCGGFYQAGVLQHLDGCAACPVLVDHRDL
jgi:hypothetical protein